MSEILSRRCSGYISLDMLYGNDEAGIDDDNTADIEQEEISAENQPDILEDA